MLTAIKPLKRAIEELSGCRIYRGTLPHGVDCFADIAKRFGRDGFKVVFDVGANVGQSSLEYLQQFPRAQIYSFEPVAATYLKLEAATSRFSRVHPFALGMGKEPGQAVIHVPQASTASSIKAGGPDDRAETIAIETVAGFAEKQGLKTIDFLKIDTEGYELEVLAGAAPLLQRQNVHFVFVECKPVQRGSKFVSLAELTEFFDGFVYRLFGVYDQQPEWDGRRSLRYWNALFICEKLVDPGARLP